MPNEPRSAERRSLRSQIATSNQALVSDGLPEVTTAPSAPPQIHLVRGGNVVLDEDLAPHLGVGTKRLNEAVKRNIERFPEGGVFQITAAELAKLDRPLSSGSRGGRRYAPWCFSEHGVVLAASVLKTPVAIAAMQHVVEVFVEARKARVAASGSSKSLPAPVLPANAQLTVKIKSALDRVLDTIVDHKNGATVREEALSVVSEAISSLRERLKKAEVENEEIAARATKLLAEAENAKATAAKTRAEADQIEFATLARKLRLVMEAELMMESGNVKGFLAVLDRLGGG